MAVASATVHFVDAGMDTGPVIAQGVVPRRDDDEVDDLKARIAAMEHRLFPMVMRLAAEGRLALAMVRWRRIAARRIAPPRPLVARCWCDRTRRRDDALDPLGESHQVCSSSTSVMETSRMISALLSSSDRPPSV